MGKILLGVWDCPACGSKGIRGDVYSCPNCSRTRSADTKFYLPAEAMEVTDAAAIAAAKAGADWRCDFCGNLNLAAKANCVQCGAVRGSRRRQAHEYDQTAAPRSAAETAEPLMEGEQPPQATAAPAAAPRRVSRWPAAGIVLVIAVLVGLGLFLFLPRASVATISGKTWERTIRVESFAPIQAQDWRESVPADGYNRNCTRALRTYVQVQTGTRSERVQECHDEAVGEETYDCGVVDLGNGRFEQKQCSRTIYEQRCNWVTKEVPVYVQQPVYDDYCTYTADRWQYARSVTANERDTEPYWPAVEYASNEREEQNGRSEAYVVYIVDRDEKTWEYPTDLSTWQKFSRGQKCILKVNRLDALVAIEPAP